MEIKTKTGGRMFNFMALGLLDFLSAASPADNCKGHSFFKGVCDLALSIFSDPFLFSGRNCPVSP